MTTARILQVNVSDGGVPKLPVPAAHVALGGVEGDRQTGETVHGGPHRAVSILGIEVIDRLRAEGHPIAPGTAGENLTTAGFDVSTLDVGTRLVIGDDLVLEISKPTSPCRTIRRSFVDGRFGRLSIKVNPADSRMYARVIREGQVRAGDPISFEAPTDPSATNHEANDRLDQAERASSVAFWEAAVAAGERVEILEDGEVAVAAAPQLPGAVFNAALGFAHLPNVVERARSHFANHEVRGWLFTDAPPWAGAIADSTLSRHLLDEAPEPWAPTGVTIRELPRREVGSWADVIVAASNMPSEIGDAWKRLEPHLALVPHHHRFVAEVDGVAVGAGSLHLHHHLGWLRAGSVLPTHRGRGIQRALILHRAAHARHVGADAVGASAIEGGSSEKNLERTGFRRIGTRHSYVVEPAT
ncbi:MAG: GNAT family N-acetyltransferase [Candidatus Limnocylindria bacterium]